MLVTSTSSVELAWSMPAAELMADTSAVVRVLTAAALAKSPSVAPVSCTAAATCVVDASGATDAEATGSTGTPEEVAQVAEPGLLVVPEGQGTHAPLPALE